MLKLVTAMGRPVCSLTSSLSPQPSPADVKILPCKMAEKRKCRGRRRKCQHTASFFNSYNRHDMGRGMPPLRQDMGLQILMRKLLPVNLTGFRMTSETRL